MRSFKNANEFTLWQIITIIIWVTASVYTKHFAGVCMSPFVLLILRDLIGLSVNQQ